MMASTLTLKSIKKIYVVNKTPRGTGALIHLIKVQVFAFARVISEG